MESVCTFKQVCSLTNVERVVASTSTSMLTLAKGEIFDDEEGDGGSPSTSLANDQL